MARSSKRAQASPDASWVLEGEESPAFSESDIDADDEAPLVTSSKIQQRTPPVASPSRTSPSSRMTKSKMTRATSSHKSPKEYTEPELVMPSMHERSNPTSRSRAAAENTGQVRKRAVHRPNSAKDHLERDDGLQISDDESLSFYARLLWAEFLLPMLGFLKTVVSNISTIVKPVLAAGLAVWIVAFLARQLVSSTLARSLAPLCYIPGMSSLNLPFCSVSLPSGPVEFDQLMTVQSSFEDVMTSSAGGVTLPADMKRSESSIRDLRHVVQFSTLPSRNELVFEFGGFIETARQASSDLTRFNSRIGRAVDNVLSTNRWTLQVIDGVAEREASRGSISRMLQGTILYPFQSAKVTEDLLLDQYLRHTRAIEEQIAELIIEAQTLLGILNNLDDRLDVIHGITTRDGITLKGSRDELLAQLWTKLGGNRSSKKKHDEQLHLLTQVSMYRKTAWDHVSGTLLKLQSISAGLEDLRERVAAPDVLGPKGEVPLKMHIEHIQLGVERLEAQRIEARKLEGEHQRKALDKGAVQSQLQLP